MAGRTAILSENPSLSASHLNPCFLYTLQLTYRIEAIKYLKRIRKKILFFVKNELVLKTLLLLLYIDRQPFIKISTSTHFCWQLTDVLYNKITTSPITITIHTVILFCTIANFSIIYLLMMEKNSTFLNEFWVRIFGHFIVRLWKSTVCYAKISKYIELLSTKIRLIV